MRQYGRKKRTKAEKKAAAIQFVIISDKSHGEKVDTLVRSYGMTEPEAHAFVKEYDIFAGKDRG